MPEAPKKPIALDANGVFGGFKVYTDGSSHDNHYTPSGWMGDWGDVKMDDSWKERPHSGPSCIRFVYGKKRSQGAGWAGVYWQDPPHNWGWREGGYNLTGATKLAFWARGKNGGEEIYEFRVGNNSSGRSDTVIAGIGPVRLTAEWKEYQIDLTDKDLSSIKAAFMWSANLMSNPGGMTFFLDDIRFE